MNQQPAIKLLSRSDDSVLLAVLVDVDGVLAGVAAAGWAALLVAGADLVVDAQVATQRWLADELAAGEAGDVVRRSLGQVGHQAADVRAETGSAFRLAVDGPGQGVPGSGGRGLGGEGHGHGDDGQGGQDGDDWSHVGEHGC